MTRDAENLDRQWDDLVRGRVPHDIDPTLRQVHAQRPAEPNPLFVSQLRSMIEVAAQEMPTPRRAIPACPVQPLRFVTDEPKTLPRPALPRRQAGRMRGLSLAGNVASAVMAAALLIAMVTAVVRYPFGGSDDTNNPATASQSTSIAAPSSPIASESESSPSSADRGRTGVQPGPGPLGVPVTVGEADVIGSAMALGDGKIVVVDRDRLTAIDADSLETVWSVDLPYGLYTAPVIAGDEIYLGYTEIREGITEYTLGADHNNQLVSMSLVDGSENWRIDGAGAFPIEPLVAEGVVYAVGSTPDAYQLRAIEPSDGNTIWAAEPFVGPEMPENSYPQSPPYLDMTLAYGNGLIVVNQVHELSVYVGATGDKAWSADAEGEELVGNATIDDGSVAATFTRQSGKADGSSWSRVAVFDLIAGDELWSNDSLSGDNGYVYVADLAVHKGNVIYGGYMSGDEDQVMTAFDGQSGDEGWRAPYWKQLDDASLSYWAPPDTTAMVGNTLYTVTLATVQGDQRRSLISAVSLQSGETMWTVIVNGQVQSAPIVAGGRVYVLTDLYGIQVLGDDPDAMASTPESGVSDLRTPLTCDVEPIDNPLEGGPIMSGTPTPAFEQWGALIASYEVPPFDPKNAVSDEIARSIGSRFGQFLECSLIGDAQLAFGFFSGSYYQRLRDLNLGTLDDERDSDGESGAMAVLMASSGERLQLDVDSLQVLPDGRIGGYVRGDTDIYVWFVIEDGVYKIDEFHRIIGDPIEPESLPASKTARLTDRKTEGRSNPPLASHFQTEVGVRPPSNLGTPRRTVRWRTNG